MSPKDRIILEQLKKFRCMTRDDIADIHFSHVKHPITQANMVLKRLRRDRLITADTSRRKYIYFPIPRIKDQSAKMMHYLAMVAFYREIRRHGEPSYLDVEPHLGEKYPEPDIEMVWNRLPVFVEIQRNIFNEKEFEAKIDRYERYFYSKKWESRPWQPKSKKVFPYVWMLTDRIYSLPKLDFEIIQYKTVDEFIQWNGEDDHADAEQGG